MEKKHFDLQGHRGCRGLLPENTIPAFIKAVDIGVTTLEMDVVVSRDNQLVVSHEPFLNREICLAPDGREIGIIEERNFNLYRMDYEEISRCDCGSKGHPRFPEQQRMKVSKPLLSAVIDTVENYVKTHRLPPVYYNIETKSVALTDTLFHPEPGKFASLLYQLLKEKGILSRSIIQSFDVRTLQWVHERDSSVQLALLVEPPDDDLITPESLDFKLQISTLGFKPAIYSPYYMLVTPELIRYAAEQNIRVIPWTVNDYKDMIALKKMGVDGIITDYPDRFRNQ